MDNILQPILAELDPSVVYIVVAVFAVLLVLTIIKKAIKLAIIVAIITGCIFMLAPMAEDFQEKYSFTVESDQLIIKTGGREYKLNNPTAIKEAKLVYTGKQTIDVKIKYTDTNLNFTIPVFMGEGIKDFLEQYDIPYKVE